MSEESLILIGRLVECVERHEKEIEKLVDKVNKLENSVNFNRKIIKMMLKNLSGDPSL